MSTPDSRRRRRLTTRLRRLFAAAAVMLAVLTGPAAVATTTDPVLPGQVGSPAPPFTSFSLGSGDPAGYITASGAWGLADSSWSMHDVDMFSGALIGEGAHSPLTTQYAVQADLVQLNQLAFDAAQLARNAQLQAEARKKEAERRGVAVERADNPGVPEPWQLKEFDGSCMPANEGKQARIELVDIFQLMCADAKADGLTGLRLNSAYRSPTRQHTLYQNAIAKYGSADAARKWVAWSDGTSCSSRHCSGAALDISSAYRAHSWLHEPVGCYDPTAGVTLGAGSCSGGDTTVIRANLYGLVAPMSWEDWHFELGLPLAGTTGNSDCSPPASLTVPEQISAIWRCRLQEAGYSAQQTDRIVAQALVVAKCESQFNASITAFNGRYRDRPHPDTGYRYTATGVFQITHATADDLNIPRDQLTDATTNIDGAARLWISEEQRGRDGWNRWACAAVNDGFAHASVLPGYPGGPDELPQWVWTWV